MKTLFQLWIAFTNLFRVNHSLGTITGWQHGAPDDLFDIPAYVNTVYKSHSCFPEVGKRRVAYVDYETRCGYYWYRNQYHQAPVYFHIPVIEFDENGKGYRIIQDVAIKTA